MIRFIRASREAMNLKKSLTASELRHPTGDPGTGADIETQRHRTVPYLVANVVDVTAAETGRTAEAEVGVGEMVQPRTPPPHQGGQKNRGGGQNGQEGGRLA